MRVSTALSYAVTLVYGLEGFDEVARLDTLSKPPVWTIGHGTTRINGEPVRQGMTCTKAEADAWAMADMATDASFILKQVRVALTDRQLAALISFCYNIGDGNFERSGVLASLNKGRYQEAADQLPDYDHAGGQEIAGLMSRRNREKALFLMDVTEPGDSHNVPSTGESLNDVC
jgi:lysozyme